MRYLLFDPDIYDFPDKHRIERFRIPVGTFRRIDNRTGRQRLLHQFAAFYHHPRLTESFGARRSRDGSQSRRPYLVGIAARSRPANLQCIPVGLGIERQRIGIPFIE